jgi:prefoldin subunit 5
MDYQEINRILDQIDKSIENQIELVTQQLSELKRQIITVEDLLNQLKDYYLKS